jgi:hypothetical protein
MTQFHVGQEVVVLRNTDTLDAPWTKGKIVKPPVLSAEGPRGPFREVSLAPGLYPVMCDGVLGLFYEKFIRAI